MCCRMLHFYGLHNSLPSWFAGLTLNPTILYHCYYYYCYIIVLCVKRDVCWYPVLQVPVPMPLPLISSRLLKHRTTRSLNARFVCRADSSAADVRQESSSSIHWRDFSCSAEDETSDSPRLQHPCGIPEVPGPQSSHLAVQIFLQNHGYTFHPEDLEKGQGDSHWKTW